MRGIIHEYHDIFTGNIIAQSRMKGVGVLSVKMQSHSVAPGVQAVLRVGLAMYVSGYRTVYMTRWTSRKLFIRKETVSPVIWYVWTKSWRV